MISASLSCFGTPYVKRIKILKKYIKIVETKENNQCVFIPCFQLKSGRWRSRLDSWWMKSVKSSRLSENVSKRLVDCWQDAEPVWDTPETKFILISMAWKTPKLEKINMRSIQKKNHFEVTEDHFGHIITLLRFVLFNALFAVWWPGELTQGQWHLGPNWKDRTSGGILENKNN